MNNNVEKFVECVNCHSMFLRKNNAVKICPSCKEKEQIYSNELIDVVCPNCKTIFKRKRYLALKNIAYCSVCRRINASENYKSVCLKKYGVENVSQLNSVKEKKKKIFEEKYGGFLMGSPSLRSQIEKTNEEKYGDRVASKSKIVKDKIKSTCKEKYGKDCFFQTDNFKEKSKITNLEKYGCEYASQSESVKEKVKDTVLKKYGKDYIFQTKDFKEKSKKTCLSHLGVEFPAQSELVLEKSKQTCLNRFGVENFQQSIEAAKHRRNIVTYDNECFDSSFELKFWKECKDIGIPIFRNLEYFDYEFGGKIHKYNPDFRINNRLIETKGGHFLKEDGTWQNPFDHSCDELFEAKHRCAIKNNVLIFYDSENWKLKLLKYFKPNKYLGYTKNSIVDFCLKQPFPGTKKWPANHPIWRSFLPGKKSPKEAWVDKNLLNKAVQNFINVLLYSEYSGKYIAFIKKCKNEFKTIQVDSNNNIISSSKKFLELVLDRFTIAKIAPKVTALKPNDMLKIIEQTKKDLSCGVYLPMAGFGGIKEACDMWAVKNKVNINIEAYDINKNFCDWYGWIQRDVLSQTIKTDKIVIVCPPFGQKYEHWEGTPDEMSDISFEDWVKLIKKHVIAKDYIFIGPEMKKSKSNCGLFARTTGIDLFLEKNNDIYSVQKM